MQFESHITIEPVDDYYLEPLERMCKLHGFKLAKLYMQKPRAVTAERSDRDTFCTGHSDNYLDLHTRMNKLVDSMRGSGLKVWRCKIEAILFDERYPHGEKN